MQINNNNKVNRVDVSNGAQVRSTRLSDVQPREKDIANAIDPNEYIGRSQVLLNSRKKVAAGKDSGLVQNIRTLKLSKITPLSKEEAMAVIKEIQLSGEVVDSISLDDDKVLEFFTGLNAFLSVATADDKSELIEETKKFTPDSFKEALSQGIPLTYLYATKQNIDELSAYIDYEDDGPINYLEKLLLANDFDKCIEKLPLICMAKGEKLNRKDIFDLSQVKEFDMITPQRANLMNRINQILPDDKKLNINCIDKFGTDEDLSQENIEKYASLLTKYSALPGIDLSSLVSFSENQSLEKLTEMLEKVDEVLESYPMDFTVSGNDKITLETIYNLTQREDIEDVQEYVNSLSPEAKFMGLSRIPSKDSELGLDKMAKLCNTICDKECGIVWFDKFWAFIDSQSDNGYKNIDGIISLIDAYKGTDMLSYRNIGEILTIPNGDYEGASEAIKIKKTMDERKCNFSNYELNRYLNNPNIDFKEFNRILKYIADNNVNYYSIPRDIYTDKNAYNKAVLHSKLKDTAYIHEQEFDELCNILNNQEELDLVLKLCNQSSKPDGSSSVKRFHDISTIKTIIELYQKDRESTLEVLDMKDESGTWRFGGHQEYWYTSDNGIIAAISAYQTNKELAKSIISGEHPISSRYSDGNDIKNIVDAYEIDSVFTENLLNSYDDSGYNERSYRIKNSEDYKYFAEKFQDDKDFTKSLLFAATEISGGSKFYKYDIETIKSILDNSKENQEHLKELLNNKEYSVSDINSIAKSFQVDAEFTMELLKNLDKDVHSSSRIKSGEDIEAIVMVSKKDKEFAKELLTYNRIGSNNGKYQRFNSSDIVNLVELAEKYGKDRVKKYIDFEVESNFGNGKYNPQYTPSDILLILEAEDKDKELVQTLLKKTKIAPNRKEYVLYNPEDIRDILIARDIDSESVDILLQKNDQKPIFLKRTGEDIINLTKACQIDRECTEYLSEMYIRDNHNVPRYKFNSFDVLDSVKILHPFYNLRNVQDINEISIAEKKNFLRNLISSNADIFNLNKDIQLHFPILPKNAEEYCTILPALVRSVGIETNELNDSQIEEFHTGMESLSNTLASLSDEEFTNLEISQEYSKNDFIRTVLDKLDAAGLSDTERQKVFDYYGFELHRNAKCANEKFPDNTTGYSIYGYPVNLNNGKKLASITDEKTKQIIEDLRSDVIRFTENNAVHCNNKDVEMLLNNIVEVLPEIRTIIGKAQHGVQDFDVLKHSLKVMQKISQNPEFAQLSDSDKRVMLMAALMHDITKAEGVADGGHPKEGSFDTYFIAKKFNLSKAEEIKLYTLIDKHEWLGFVNDDRITSEERGKRMQSVAFDLQQGNLFDLSLIFTKADLIAVRKEINDVIREYTAAAESYAPTIRANITELKKSQPLLPTTKMPSASRIKEAITVVNDDGSTNIKGVYVNNDGLVVVKFNEVEDWETIGLLKGSKSRGIEAKGVIGTYNIQETTVDTGNIKFFVHGLDYANQAAKFDAFALPDSDALLSVSYAERPESKYRFFRPQGLMLEVDPDYVYGGGNTDAGSGCGKNIDEFKNNYVFGGHREEDRKYISNLIKEATGMSDEEYVQFVEDNKDKQLTEIEPKELQETIIRQLATINSNVRKGDRSYNEMYISNPKGIMGVFAYDEQSPSNVGNPVEFLEAQKHRTSFLQKYALEHDVPFFVLGD